LITWHKGKYRQWRLKGGEAMRKLPTLYWHRKMQPEKIYSSHNISSGGVVEWPRLIKPAKARLGVAFDFISPCEPKLR
jgi:hypothetical protein